MILCCMELLFWEALKLFYGDFSFEFYSKKDNGEFLAHCHFQSVSEAEKAVVDFMNGKLTITQFGQPKDI